MNVVIFALLQKLNASQIKLFVTVMRSIWKRRNLKLWQQKNETNAQVVERAMHLLDDWNVTQIIHSGKNSIVNVQQQSPTHQDTFIAKTSKW